MRLQHYDKDIREWLMQLAQTQSDFYNHLNMVTDKINSKGYEKVTDEDVLETLEDWS